MAEVGARPKVPVGRRTALRLVRRLFSPLRPDDYLEMINPLWTTRELRGRVVRIESQGSEAASVIIRPAYEWPGHKPGQYVRLGVIVNGRYYWRAYSLTSDPAVHDGLISVTPKRVSGGVVSPHLVERIQPGDLVRLGEVEGMFTLPEQLPDKLLFISAGSGITPIVSMLRSLDRRAVLDDAVIIHSARTREQGMFLPVLEDLDSRHDNVRLELRLTAEQGRLSTSDLDRTCPDWREREAFCSGPGEMLDDIVERWEADGDPDRLHLERFQPKISGGDNAGSGGQVSFLDSDETVDCDGSTSILDAGEQAGLELAHGCRIGVCHTCVGTLKSGQLRDLRSGEVSDTTDQDVRICINTAEGDVELQL